MHRGSLAVLLLAAVFVSATSAQQPAARKKITVKEMLAQPTFGGYQLSPDGNTVLFTRTDRDPKDWTGTSHIWLHDLATGKSLQLTSSPKGESNPRFLPDGRVAFVSNRDTKNAWWVISPNGGEATKLFE